MYKENYHVSHTHTHTTGTSPVVIPPQTLGIEELLFIVLAIDSTGEAAASVLNIEIPTSPPTTAAPGHPL